MLFFSVLLDMLDLVSKEAYVCYRESQFIISNTINWILQSFFKSMDMNIKFIKKIEKSNKIFCILVSKYLLL